MKLRIDAEFQALIPPLAAAELEQLTANIITEGCRDPLVHWKGVLIDGHNRHRICTEHGVAFQMVEREFESRDEVKIWILENQLGRRNLTPTVRLDLGLLLAPLKAAQGKQNQQIRKGEQAGATLTTLSKLEPVNTRAFIAQVADVSEGTVDKYKAIIAKAPIEILAKVRTGEVSINSAFNDIRATEKEERREARRDSNRQLIGKAPDPLKAGAKFATILMDPPWDYDGADILGRGGVDYGTMTVAQI